uniref:Uncharacterized protein n=1 Tax=Vitis vinifera TaxID=29760 RepID=F6HEJ5_VITVI
MKDNSRVSKLFSHIPLTSFSFGTPERFPREYISKFDLLYPLEVVTDQSNLLGDQPWFHSSNRRLREVSAKASISRFKENRISEPSPK